MRTDTPRTVYLSDYTPPAWLVDDIGLTFQIFEERTLVRAVTKFRRNHEGNQPLELNGEHLKLLSVKLDGGEPEYKLSDDLLTVTIPAGTDRFTLEVETEIDPASNTRLEGLYKSGGNWCTQCEAEGFRTITCFPDRPDIMTVFTTRIEADKATCPVLLSNGNLVEEGELENGRHYAVWHDPFPKPCYLFALVAGNLEYIQDFFMTRSGRRVDLRIYVRDGDQDQCYHAMESLKNSMKWDEEVYGREYELDRFNIVAVSDFNMGAMENTSLNIFNTALVLAHQDTATDLDFERVEGVIAHEYFHNWTGNRVTCRDWFQLSLKEGLTVFRDQQFSADMNSPTVQRIDDVTMLRRLQFAEDASPLAHPVRPDNYIEINNFYTVTVYEKGAEVIRMQHTLLGPETYRKGTDLYFERFDGMAVTCEDFVKCMEDASGRDLSQFFRWYRQAGTPEVTARGAYDAEARTYTLELNQKVPPTPGQPGKNPMHIPVRVGLVGSNGEDMAEKLLELTEEKQAFTFENIASKPVPSILRGFSAPVKLQTDLSNDDLRFLMVHDSDGFNRWEAGQTYALRLFGEMVDKAESSQEPCIWPDFFSSFGELIDVAARPESDKALAARTLTLPDTHIIGQQREIVDPPLIHRLREQVKAAIADRFRDKLESLYHANNDNTYSHDFDARSRRALKNTVLRLLDDTGLAKAQYDNAHNMTDRVAALGVLADTDTPERAEAFADFFDRFEEYPLVIDKWFSLQAMALRPDTLDDIVGLRTHPAFNLKNPNRVRSLYAAFAMNNPAFFHEETGRGYELLAEAVAELNEINPQIAARLLTPFKDWRRYTQDRQERIREKLEKLAAIESLSPDVYEIVTKSLKG